MADFIALSSSFASVMIQYEAMQTSLLSVIIFMQVKQIKKESNHCKEIAKYVQQ